MKRFWAKWNSCRSCIRARGIIGGALQLLGSMLVSFAIMYAVQAAAKSNAAAPVYQAGACAGCPAGSSFESVQVQAREGSILFAVGGTLPAAVPGLPSDVRLEANDLDIVLRPDVAGFRIVSATRAGMALAPDTIAAGIANGHLLIDLRGSALQAPVTFALGHWKDGAYLGRIPASGLLEWDGKGAPRPRAAGSATAAPVVLATVGAATPAPTASGAAAATPAPTTSGPDVTTLAAPCTSFTAQLAAFPRPAAAATGNGPDPRTNLPRPFVSTTFAAAVPANASARPPFTVTIVLARTGEAAGTGARTIDRAGSVQLWAYWDGTTMHKAIRTWNGRSWDVRTNTGADELTVALRTTSIAFFWDGFRSGDQYGSIVAASGGCRSIGTDDQARPQVRIP